MVRTQIQLTREQAHALRDLAARRGVSMAEIIRIAVQREIDQTDRAERRRRALTAAGRFSGPPDLSVNHDSYLAEDFA